MSALCLISKRWLIFARNFNKFMKLNQKSGSDGQNFRKLGNGSGQIQQSDNCFECQGRCHKAFECPTKMKRLENESGNKKRMYATLSDDEKNPDTQ